MLPLVALVAAVLWQAVVAGQAVWLAGGAARAAARAQAVGGDPAAAARTALPPALRRGLQTVVGDDGAVRVRVRISSVVAGHQGLATVDARARFAPQGG